MLKSIKKDSHSPTTNELSTVELYKFNEIKLS